MVFEGEKILQFLFFSPCSSFFSLFYSSGKKVETFFDPFHVAPCVLINPKWMGDPRIYVVRSKGREKNPIKNKDLFLPFWIFLLLFLVSSLPIYVLFRSFIIFAIISSICIWYCMVKTKRNLLSGGIIFACRKSFCFTFIVKILQITFVNQNKQRYTWILKTPPSVNKLFIEWG